MARDEASRSALVAGAPAPAVPLTLADVQARLADVPDLTRQQRTDLRSALNAVGRALGRPLTTIPSSPNMLRDALEKVSPAAIGIAPASWNNIRSRLNTALRLSGVPAMRGRRVVLLDPAWQALYERLPGRREKAALSRFMTFCSSRRIAPDRVTAATFDAFQESVELQSLRRRPQDGYRETARAWNPARSDVDGWPGVTVEVPDRRDWYALSWKDFPASLKADVDAMVSDCTGVDLVTMKARTRIKKTSAQSRVSHLLRLASGYVHRGGDPAALRTLGDLLVPEVVAEGLRFHLGRSDGTPTIHHDAMMRTVCAVASQWVGVSEAGQQDLKRLKRSLAVERHGMAAETRALLRRFDDPGLRMRLFEEPGRILRRVAGGPAISPASAARAAAALGVQILIEAPMRSRNLASVDLDRHLHWTGTSTSRRAVIHLPGESVKNGVEMLLPLSPETTALLDLYLQRIRPVLLRRSGPYLFPAQDGGPIRSAYLSSRIAQFMLDTVGVRMTAHKFRHLCGYLFLKANPGQYEVVRRLLGHRDINTTVMFYAPLAQDEAFVHWDTTLTNVKAETAAAAAATVRRRRSR